jgi:flagellar biosynthetic protein FliQ
MNEIDAIELVQSAIWTVLVVAGPPVVAGMIAGIVVALLQALTQVQEVTLTFVPKILVIFAAMTLLAPVLGAELYAFTELAYSRIESGY